MSRRGLDFGIFLAPFHRLGENPTLGFARDLELIEWLDHLGYDEAWIGEHHSAGWETIAAPEIFMAAAAERTRHIRLGSGVTSLPYHNPFMVAQRFVQLDHMTRGRTMLGCGPGALTSDAYMLAIDPVTQRNRMVESLDTIVELLKCEEPVTKKTDWFELKNARLHLAPYSDPCFPIAVASTITPFGMTAAGRHGVGVLSIGAGLPGGPEALAKQWQIAEETAAKHGVKMNRKNWRVVVVMHIAEEKEQAKSQEDIYAEESIYTKFTSNKDTALFPTWHAAPWKEKLNLLDKFDDDRLVGFGKKIIFQEAPEVLPEAMYKSIRREIAKRILSERKEKWWTIPTLYNEIDTLREKYTNENDNEKLALLDEFNTYAMSIQKKYENV